MRAVIADDEPRARQFLERLLSEHEDMEVVGSAKNGRAFGCRISTLVRGKTKQSSLIGPESRNSGCVGGHRNAPMVMDSVANTIRSGAGAGMRSL